MTLRASWTFDAGSSHDDSGNGHDGTDTHVTYGDPHVVGKGAQFDGTNNNRIDLASPVVFATGAWTIEGWAEPFSSPGGTGRALVFGNSATAEGIFWRGTNFGIALKNGGGGPFNHDFLPTPNAFPNVKYHWAVASTGTGGDLHVYLNGLLVNTYSGWGVPLTLNCFGYDGATEKFDGMIDEVNAWDTVFTDAQVAARYTAGIGASGGDTTAPVITLVSPLTGVLASGGQVAVEATDETAFGEIFIFAENERIGLYEVIFDGLAFAPRYAPAPSSESLITNGLQWTFTRAGGWPDGELAITVEAIDAAGNKTRQSFGFAVNVPDVLVPSSTTPAAAELLRDEQLDAFTGDVELDGTGGDQVFAYDVDGIESDVKSAWLQVKGEWFLNLEEGVDWFGKVFVKNPDLGDIRAEFKRVALTCPGVVDLPTFNPVLDVPSRTMTADYEIRLDNGQVIAGSATLSPASGQGA